LKNHDSLYVSENYDSSIKDGGEKKRQLPGEAEKSEVFDTDSHVSQPKIQEKAKSKRP
jgi:hypothetical protein